MRTMTFTDLVVSKLVEVLGEGPVLADLQFVDGMAVLFVYDGAQAIAVQGLDGKDGLTVCVYVDTQGRKPCWRLTIIGA